MKRITLIALFLCSYLFAYSQTSAPIRPAAKLNVSVATGSNPYTLTVSILDDLSRFTFADFGVGDSVYLVDGSDLLIYVVTSKLTSPNRLVVNDVNNTGISAPTGQGAIIKSTANYKLPVYISGLRDDLRSMIMNRFSQLLDGTIYTASNEIYRYVGTTGVAPAVTAAVAGAVTAQNTVGEIYTWNPATNLTSGAWSIVSGGGATDSLESARHLMTWTQSDKRNIRSTEKGLTTVNYADTLQSIGFSLPTLNPRGGSIQGTDIMLLDDGVSAKKVTVDSLKAAVSNIATNGLTKTGSTVALGGALTGATTITTTATNTLAIAGLQGVGVVKTDSLLVQNASTGLVKYRTTSETWDSLNIKDGGIAARELNKTAIDTVTTLVPNVAYMKTLKRATGAVINTQGFTSANDGGGARYVIEATGTVDNMTVFLMADGKFAKLQANADGGINLKQLGAIPNDGIADQVQFQKAIDVFKYVYADGNGDIYSIKTRILPRSNTKIVLGKNTIMRNDSTAKDILIYANRDSNITIIGGVWDFYNVNKVSSQAQGTLPNATLTDYGVLFDSCKTVMLDGMNVINTLKYAFFMVRFNNVTIQNANVFNFSDAYHFEIGKTAKLLNSHVKFCSDDVVAIAGANYVSSGWAGGGDIEDMVVENITVDSTDDGNFIKLFPGNKGAAFGYRNNTIRNLKVDGIYGKSEPQGVVINLSQDGTGLTDPERGLCFNGVLENATFSNIFAKQGSTTENIVISLDTIRNVTFDNVFSTNRGIGIYKGFVSNLVFNNLHYLDQIFKFMSIQDSAKVDRLTISNSVITSKSPLTEWISVNPVINSTPTLVLNNNVFSGTGTPKNYINIDSVTIIDNFNKYTTLSAFGWSVLKPEVKVFVNGTDFSSTSYGIYSSGTGTNTKIYATSYVTTATTTNTFRNDGVATHTLESVNIAKDNYVTQNSSVYTLGNGDESIGTVIQLKNTQTSAVTSVTAAASNTINGSATAFLLNGKQGVTFRKIAATNWESTTDGGATTWSIAGNNGLVGGEFLGSKTNTDFRFISNNIERGRLEALGTWWLGKFKASTALVTINADDGAALNKDPLQIYGIKAGSISDSIGTLSAGLLKRMAMSDWGIATSSNSTSTGLRINQLTTTERDAWRAGGSLAGDLVYNSTLGKFQISDPSAVWQTVSSYVGEGSIDITTTITAGNNLSGGGTPPTITVTNAAVGDYVDIMIVDDSNDLTDINVKAWVSATDTVSYQIENKRATSIVFTKQTLKVRVKK